MRCGENIRAKPVVRSAVQTFRGYRNNVLEKNLKGYDSEQNYKFLQKYKCLQKKNQRSFIKINERGSSKVCEEFWNFFSQNVLQKFRVVCPPHGPPHGPPNFFFFRFGPPGSVLYFFLLLYCCVPLYKFSLVWFTFFFSN